MKKKKLLQLILLLMGFFWGLSLNSANHKNFSQETQYPNTSIQISPIIINGNIELDDFCSGNGTNGLSWSSAHIIKDYIINSGGSFAGIILENTTRFLIIENCTVTNGAYTGYGIYLNHSSNIKIQNNTVINNEGTGIEVFGTNNTIYDNYIDNNRIAINITGSNNIISNNYISNHLSDSIYVFTTKLPTNIISFNRIENGDGGLRMLGPKGEENGENQVLNNTFVNNNQPCIYGDNSNNNMILGNVIWNNSYTGIYFTNSKHNVISYNNISENHYNGIILENSSNNNITYNIISSNSFNGIQLGFESINNDISWNIIHNNGGDCIKDLSENNYIHDNDCKSKAILSYNIPIIIGIIMIYPIVKNKKIKK